jgi:hypothetical protein
MFGCGGDEGPIATKEHLQWVLVVSEEEQGEGVGKGSPKIVIETRKETNQHREDIAHIRGRSMATPATQAKVRSAGGVDVGEASVMTCQRQHAELARTRSGDINYNGYTSSCMS